MEVIITKKARNDLLDFYNHSKFTTKNLILYINEIIDYSQSIQYFPEIGKVVDYIKQYKLRQLIYKKHKILYINFNSKIYILRYIHSSRNFNMKKNIINPQDFKLF